MNKTVLPELMKVSALQKEKSFYLDAPDDQIAFEVPINTIHSDLELKSTGKISVPMKSVKRLFELASNDNELCARVKVYRKTLKGEIEGNLRGPDPEDDPRFAIYADFAKLLNVDHNKYPVSAVFQKLSAIVMKMIEED